MKTVRQLADEIGVSKQAVRKHVAKLPHGYVTTGTNRTTLINDTGTALIKSWMTTVGDNQSTTSGNQSLQLLQLEYQIAMLKMELDLEKKGFADKKEIYERELAAKDKQISDSQTTIREIMETMEQAVTALNASQALHAGTMHKQLGAGPGEPQPEDIAELAHQDPEKKPSLFARLFGNK